MADENLTLADCVEAEELPRRVASLRELAALLAETSRDLRVAQRLVLCAATQLENERRVSVALRESERQRATGMLSEHPVLSIKDVMRMLGVSRATLYRWDREGLFVRPVQMQHGGRKGYITNEVEEWLRRRQKLGPSRSTG